MNRISALNSSIQPLAASGTFTGTAEECLNLPEIIITVKTDTDGTLYIDFSPDGTNWDRTLPYVVQAATSELQAVAAVMAYFRIRYVNGSTAQTYFRLQTLQADEVQPRTALNSTIIQPDSSTILTRSAILSAPFLQNIRGSIAANMVTAENVLLAGGPFEGTTLDTNYYTLTSANGGTAAISVGSCRVRTGSSANGASTINSNQYAIFLAGRPNNFGCTLALSHTGTANNITEWGIGTETDRLVFRLSGTTLSCVLRSANSDVFDVAVANWNSNRTAPTLTVLNFYEIHYNSLFAYFLINGVVMHVITLQQQAYTTGLIESLNLPIRISNINSSNSTSDLSAYVSGVVVLGAGSGEPQSIYKNITSATTTVCKRYSGVLRRIVLNTAANGTVKLYDATSAANIFASITVSSTDIPTMWEFNTQFNNGLTVVTSAATDITVIYE